MKFIVYKWTHSLYSYICTDRLRFVKEKEKTIDGVMLQAVQVLNVFVFLFHVNIVLVF